MLAAFASLVENVDRQKLILLTYSCISTNPDTDLMFWKINSFELDEIQTTLPPTSTASPIAGYLSHPHSYLAQTKRSTYIDKLDPSTTNHRRHPAFGKHKYVFVYPFVKTREWYLLSRQARQGIMDEHIEIGTKYQSVKLNTTYSFGLDDQEFVVAFKPKTPATSWI